MKTQIFFMLAIISLTNVSFVQAEAVDPIMASQSAEGDSGFSISNIRANLLRDLSAACLIGSITCELANFYGSGSF